MLVIATPDTRGERAGEIFIGEQELAKGMTEYVLKNFSANSSGGGH
jgi:CPA2 family monovalent cation:H+ antiporter-2